jgi:hypothetical protein
LGGRGRWISVFEASLVYKVRSRTARVVQRNPISKNLKKKKKYTEQRKNIKLFKGKGQVRYKGRPIRITPDVSTETIKARRALSEVMQTLREHKCQPRLI